MFRAVRGASKGFLNRGFLSRGFSQKVSPPKSFCFTRLCKVAATAGLAGTGLFIANSFYNKNSENLSQSRAENIAARLRQCKTNVEREETLLDANRDYIVTFDDLASVLSALLSANSLTSYEYENFLILLKKQINGTVNSYDRFEDLIEKATFQINNFHFVPTAFTSVFTTINKNVEFQNKNQKIVRQQKLCKELLSILEPEQLRKIFDTTTKITKFCQRFSEKSPEVCEAFKAKLGSDYITKIKEEEDHRYQNPPASSRRRGGGGGIYI